jgi:hypothetical protein
LVSDPFFQKTKKMIYSLKTAHIKYVNRGKWLSRNILLMIGIVPSLLIFCCAGNQKNINQEFNPVTIKVGKGAGSVELADVNRDGFTDIAVANTGDSSVTILLGQANGKFSEAQGSPFFANRFPNDLVIADLNGDGNLDIGIANTEVSMLTILFGNGKGQFNQDINSRIAVNSRPHTHGIATGDFNNDGKADLATDSWGENSIVLIYGNGRGGFTNPQKYEVGNRPYQRLRAADVNNDGRTDLVTTNLEGGNVTVLLNQQDGKLLEAPGSPFAAGDAPFGVAIGDINGDGNIDLAVVNSPTITSENKGKDGLTILLGNGTGKFTAAAGSPFQTGKSPSRVAIGDLNGDGINDVAVTNYNEKSISIYSMNRYGQGEQQVIPVGNHPDGIAIGDLNQDGKKDLVVSNFDDGTLMLFFNK